MRHFGLHLNALRAFECAARLSSFSLAAKELNVTHSTVSHHISGLEKSLGVELFLRQNRRVYLTAAGRDLFPVLESSFDQISTTLAALRASDASTPLKVTVTPSFANKWLIPRLSDFRNSHPEIEVQLQTSLSLAKLNQHGLSVGVRAGKGHWQNLNAELLMPIHLTPMCSPRILEGREPPRTPDMLRDFTLLHADVSPETGIDSEWGEWLAATGTKDVDTRRGLSFHDPGLSLQAAIDGLGVAMGYVELAEIDILEGRLVRLFEEEIQHPWSYYTVVPAERSDPQTTIFCEWMRNHLLETNKKGRRNGSP